MQKTAEQSPLIHSNETEQPLASAELVALMDRRWEMLELSPYVDRDKNQNGPAQLAYDKIRSELELNRPLTDEQMNAAQYLMDESSLLEAQLTVDMRLVQDPNKFEEAIRQGYENRVQILEDDDAGATPQDIEELEAQIDIFATVIDRLEEGEKLPDGSVLLDYLNFSDFANTWERQSIVDVSDDKVKWIEAAREQKLHALQEAMHAIRAQWQAYLLLADRYPSKLATGEGVDEENNNS